jgi:hypothetical protein
LFLGYNLYMGMEKLSAASIDRPKNDSFGLEKKDAVEHLRDMRNMLTPFIGDYVNEVRAGNVSPEALSTLKCVGYQGELVGNPYDLIRDMQSQSITPNELEWASNWGNFDHLAYEDYCRKNKIEDSPVSKAAFEEKRTQVRTLLDNHDLHPDDVSKIFEDYLDYTEHNTKGLRGESLGEMWWNDERIERFVAGDNLIGRPLIHDEENNFFPPIVSIPVGEYGTATALKIYDTVQVLLSKTLVLKEKSAELVNSHKEIFAKSARGAQDLRQMQDMSLAALKSMQEGIVTLGQAVAQLSMQRLQGYENDPDKLIQDLIANELPNQLGYLAPPAYIGPFSLIGDYIENLVVKNEEDKLVINPEILVVFKEVKDAIINGNLVEPSGDGSLPSAGRGCPVSFKGQGIKTSGINELSQLFLEIYKKDPTNTKERIIAMPKSS